MNQNNSLIRNSSADNADANFTNDEIDLRDLISVLWAGKLLIIVITTLFAITGLVYALTQPNTYVSEATLVPAASEGRSGLAGMAAQFGGLASLAGINLGASGGDDTTIALATLESRQFINAFITKHQLLVPLMASKKWDRSTGELIVDDELYDVETDQWVRDVDLPKKPKPSDWEAYEQFKEEVLNVSQAKDSGLVTIEVTHNSPIIAQQWATLLVEDLNAWMKQKSLMETKRNIAYLTQQLEKTSITEMRSVFFQLIEDQTKQLMLAEVETEFSFRTIDPAVVAEEKAGPKRALICALSVLLGFMLSVLIVLVRNFIYKDSN
ncbi:Wzz/FepE/Etk N-terminal domain-containing protein [Ferrimonas sp. YFM]|uniref:Wzz/FepE/Etk N-terminal domain-containing protein n=1 Tax=Ferrimonas sp. YFM TaxID=3028878 RepID=UPI002573313E|nr:Wzz/FepE/Etk N-terminal domain-containing protein [Ferrimonas sp. YFM]BDY04066.1 LPS biosynthesis protein [Ferrimonas sp. YFM]